MPLMSLWEANPEAFSKFTIEQVVSTAGNGTLKDESECSYELRAYLAEANTEKLAEYAEHCLSRSFAKSGQVLQDIVNELGKRLEYEVQNGRYQGGKAVIGHDGLWRAEDGHAIVIEVKTTDAYRISLDTLISYRERLRANGFLGEHASILIVVGREDTGDLEAQVRGSRHAWDIRLISVDALLKLVDIRENTEGDETLYKIRSLLLPFEYTKVDNIIDVMFTAAKDVEQATESELIGVDDVKNTGQRKDKNSKKNGIDITSQEEIKEKRDKLISRIGRINGATLLKKSRALYWSSDKEFRVSCTMSKRYLRETERSVKYWYAYHPKWDEFLAQGDRAFFVLGAMDLEFAFVIPHDVIGKVRDFLNYTTRSDGKKYWHIHILEPSEGVYCLNVAKSGEDLSLNEFMVAL